VANQAELSRHNAPKKPNSAILLVLELKLKSGRPAGSKTFEPEITQSFGSIVREFRTKLGISQGELGRRAQIERSHMGKIERGLHLPYLALTLKLAGALSAPASGLVDRTALSLASGNRAASYVDDADLIPSSGGLCGSCPLHRLLLSH